MGNGILAVWTDCAADGRSGLQRVVQTAKHLPERVGVPGFLKGCALPRCRGRPGLFHLGTGTKTVGVLASKSLSRSPERPDRLDGARDARLPQHHPLGNDGRGRGRAEASVGAWAAVLRADEGLGRGRSGGAGRRRGGAERVALASRHRGNGGARPWKPPIRGPDTQAARAVAWSRRRRKQRRGARAGALAVHGEVGVYALMAVLASEDLGG